MLRRIRWDELGWGAEGGSVKKDVDKASHKDDACQWLIEG
jgi:hypothetical protein